MRKNEFWNQNSMSKFRFWSSRRIRAIVRCSLVIALTPEGKLPNSPASAQAKAKGARITLHLLGTLFVNSLIHCSPPSGLDEGQSRKNCTGTEER
jgi:hypothetical protein